MEADLFMAWNMAQNHHQTSRTIFFLSAGKPGISQVYPLDMFREVVAHAQAGTTPVVFWMMVGVTGRRH